MCDKKKFSWQQNDLRQQKEFRTTDSQKNKLSLDNLASVSLLFWG